MDSLLVTVDSDQKEILDPSMEKECLKRKTTHFWQTFKDSSLMTEGMWRTGTQNTKRDLRVTAKDDYIHGFLLSLSCNFARLVASVPAQKRDQSLDHSGKLNNVAHILLFLVLF